MHGAVKLVLAESKSKNGRGRRGEGAQDNGSRALKRVGGESVLPVEIPVRRSYAGASSV